MTNEKVFERIEAEEAQKPEQEPPKNRQNVIHTVDLSKMTPQTHRWVDRGHVMSCEGAGHASHRTFKRLSRSADVPTTSAEQGHLQPDPGKPSP